MKNVLFRKLTRSAEQSGVPLMSAVICYPEIEGCKKISAFYEKFALSLGDYASAAAEKKKQAVGENRHITVKLIPRLRNLTEKRADFTFDVIISEDGTLLRYFRTAHIWSLDDERLVFCGKNGAEHFSDGKNEIEIVNLFGNKNFDRISNCIAEKIRS